MKTTIELARKAGIFITSDFAEKQFEQFAALVRADEREGALPAPQGETVAWVLLREDEDGFEPIRFYGGREKPETVADLKPRFTLRPVCFADTTPPAVNAPDRACECNQGQVCGVCDPITRTVYESL